jgi:hypothetical protein
VVDSDPWRMLLAGSDGVGHRSRKVGGHQFQLVARPRHADVRQAINSLYW